MGKPKRKEHEAEKPQPPSKPASPAKKAPSASASEAQVTDAEVQAMKAAESPQAKGFFASLLPEKGLLPWWVVLLVATYLLLKLGLTLEHPCGVLGISGRVTRPTLSKAFRTISMCTHPDKLVEYSPAEVRRGELLFKRASSARDTMMAALRDLDEDAPADGLCSTQLDAAIWQAVQLFFGWAFETGGVAMLTSVYDFLYALLTFEYDVST